MLHEDRILDFFSSLDFLFCFLKNSNASLKETKDSKGRRNKSCTGPLVLLCSARNSFQIRTVWNSKGKGGDAIPGMQKRLQFQMKRLCTQLDVVLR